MCKTYSTGVKVSVWSNGLAVHRPGHQTDFLRWEGEEAYAVAVAAVAGDMPGYVLADWIEEREVEADDWRGERDWVAELAGLLRAAE